MSLVKFTITLIATTMMAGSALSDVVMSPLLSSQSTLNLSDQKYEQPKTTTDVISLLRIDPKLSAQLDQTIRESDHIKKVYSFLYRDKPVFDLKLFIVYKDGQVHHVKFESDHKPTTDIESEHHDWFISDDYKTVVGQIISEYDFLEFIINREVTGYYLTHTGKLIPALRHDIIMDNNTVEITSSLISKKELKRVSLNFHVNNEQQFVAYDNESYNLPDLESPSIFSGKYIKIITSKKYDVTSKDNVFNEADLDQYDAAFVHAYKNISDSKDWFSTSYAPGTLDEVLWVYPNKLNSQDVNNAFFVPADQSPSGYTEIHLGRGDGVEMRNISISPEVAMHEYGHSIIYRYLKSAQDESGYIHEGTADFFVATKFNSPIIGQDLMIKEEYLRRIDIAAGKQYTDIDGYTGKYGKSLYWSAMLWDISKEVGNEKGKALATQMIKYLSDKSGFRDAIIGLLHASMDLTLNTETGEHEYCVILKHAVDRGFGAFLENIPQKDCSTDVESAVIVGSARLSKKESFEAEENKSDERIIKNFCATLGTTAKPTVPLAILFVVPLALGLRRRTRGYS